MAEFIRLKPKPRTSSNNALTRVVGGGLKNIAQLPFHAIELLTQPDPTYEGEYDRGQSQVQPRFKPSEILEENVYKPLLGDTNPQGMVEQGAQKLVELLALNPTSLGASLGKSGTAILDALKSGGKMAATKIAAQEISRNPILQKELSAAIGITTGGNIGESAGGFVGESIGGEQGRNIGKSIGGIAGSMGGDIGGRYLQDRFSRGAPLTSGERLEDVLAVTEPLKKDLYQKAEDLGKKIVVDEDKIKEEIRKYQKATENKLTPEPWQAAKKEQLSRDLESIQKQLSPEMRLTADSLHEVDKNINDAIGKASDPEMYNKISAIIKKQMEETGSVNPYWLSTLKDAKELHKLANAESKITRAFNRAGELSDAFEVKNIKIFKEFNKLKMGNTAKFLTAAGLNAMGLAPKISIPMLFGLSGIKKSAQIYDSIQKNRGLRDFINKSPQFADANKKLLDAVNTLSPASSLSNIKDASLRSALTNFNTVAKDYEKSKSKTQKKEYPGFIRLR
jgi:uncharacterized protein YcfJ